MRIVWPEIFLIETSRMSAQKGRRVTTSNREIVLEKRKQKYLSTFLRSQKSPQLIEINQLRNYE